MGAMTATEPVKHRWRNLCKMGGASALIIALLLIGESIVYALLPSTNTPIEIFSLFQRNWLLGLLHFDLLGMIAYLFFIPFTLALYATMKRTDESLMLVAVVLFFIGVAAFFATNTGFSALSLSHQYEIAKTQEERLLLLAACQAMITLFNVNAFLVSYVIVSAAWVMIGVAMLQATVFSRLASYASLLAGACGIIAVLLEHISENTVGTAIAFYFAAIVFLFIWCVTAGTRLYRMGSRV